ncbi:MAG: hypothetical protein HYV34_03575 [Candidatus Kerfeldbacteria bacterium]|nr:hypothetical protein [Candidatus Kerfeldbacteria bacterium]
MKEQERATIIAFLERWAQLKSHPLDSTGIDFPEDHFSTLSKQEQGNLIDAKVDTLKLALELTSCDVLAKQREYNAFFRDICIPIEEQLKGRAHNAITIIIPHEAVTQSDWRKNGELLQLWLFEHFDEIDALSVGNHPLQVPGLPFDVSIRVLESNSPGVRCGRSVKDDTSFDQRLYDTATSKIKKLRFYKERGYHSILLVENNDLALMNADIIHASIQRNKSLFEQVDEVWHVDSSIQESSEYFLFEGSRMLRVTAKDKGYVSF